MNPFITYRDYDGAGQLCYYVLQREFPHYVGVVSNIPVSGAMCCTPIPGYNMYIVFAGALRGNYIPAYKDVELEIEKVFNDMASWYYEKRILVNPERYKKFKVSNQDGDKQRSNFAKE